MTRLKKYAIVFVALLAIASAISLILVRDETGTVVLGSSVIIGLMVYLIIFVAVPIHRTFTIDNTQHGMATIGSGSIKRLVHKAVVKKGVKGFECEVTKLQPNEMTIRIISGISTATNAVDFIQEVQDEVKEVVEQGTGLVVSKVDVHIWHYRGKKNV